MGYLAVISSTRGKQAGFKTVAGIATGLLIIGILTAYGLSALVGTSPVAYNIMRYGGIAYMLWLAWDIWHDNAEEKNESSLNYTPLNKFFRRGLITNLLNPKAAIFYIAMLPTFFSPAHDPLLQALLLTFIYVVIATIIHIVIVLLAERAHDLMLNGHFRKRANIIFSIMLALVALWFAWETRVPISPS